MRLDVPYEWGQEVYVVVFQPAVCPVCRSEVQVSGRYVVEPSQLVALEIGKNGVTQVGTAKSGVIENTCWAEASLVFATAAAAQITANRVNKEERRPWHDETA